MKAVPTALLALAALALLAAPPARGQNLSGKKVMFLNSYHEGYEWSDEIEKGVRMVLGPTGARLEFYRMDTKRNQSEEFRKQAGEKARAAIEAFRPDLVIAADDNAVKYVLVQYYKNAKLPFVFCGVNWDASRYGLPFSNATGMEEVALVKELLENLRVYAKGKRVGFLTVDSETERIEGPWYTKRLGLSFTRESYVKTLADWKAEFARMQNEVDVLLLGNYSGINDWDEKEAAAFALANTRVPSGGMYDFMMPYSMLGLVKVAEEQGIWSAKTAVKILQGTPPSKIAVLQNKQGKTMINLKLAQKGGVVFRPELTRNAQVMK
ncbi:MAG TPA: ABC transporter substrate binding protein [Anaeromyxobacteraceae bacterium]|nr:ABC transporter substrate binding protein [Anaeromyxobacteraceae bacterium]